MTRNYISNKDETPRIFNSDLLESLSRVHWTVPLYVFLPIITYSLYNSIFSLKIELTGIVIYIIMGLFIWTFTEYFLHRFVFHFKPASNLGKRLHFMFHGVHHDYPNDSKRLVMPPTASIPIALLFFLCFQFLLGSESVFPFFTGFISGYLFYDITHYAIHHFNMKSKLFLYIKNHHMRHHYQNADKGFGVSQPTWDYIFRTNFPE